MYVLTSVPQIKFDGDPAIEDLETWEGVVGSKEEVYYDEDFGLFSAIVACYNNHWALRTSVDDWWNVVVRTVAQEVSWLTVEV